VRLNEIPFVDFLLLGGGLASATAAETLRTAGVEGSVAVLCAETKLPYYRPPLSKRRESDPYNDARLPAPGETPA
jgi:hypothetical protein